MRTPTPTIFAFVALAMTIAASPDGQTTALPARAGLAEVEITPPIGYRMDGYFTERLSTGVKDPLMAKALVFQQGNTKAALVVCDLLGVPHALSREVRARAAARTGIPAANIAVTGTHTHTGPLFSGERARIFSDRAAAEHGSDPLASINYIETLRDRLVDTIVAADAGLSPATLEFVSAREDRVSFNRRYRLNDGTVATNPGISNPKILGPAGPIDPDLPFLLISKEKTPVGSLTVFAMHLDTVGGTEYSADYAGHLATEFRREFGDRFISVFGTGTCGNINHIDVSGKRRHSARLIGEQLAVSALSVRSREPVANLALAAASGRVSLRLRQVSDAQVAAARANVARIGTNDLPFLTQVETVSTLDLSSRGPTLDAEVQVVRLNRETAIVLLPGEVFVELGLAIKQASPFRHTLVIELSNDNPAYIPTEQAFKEGGYETVNSRIEPGGGEQLVAEALRLLKTLQIRD
jgi:neutral/alkaline ceramidase-like enzyme